MVEQIRLCGSSRLNWKARVETGPICDWPPVGAERQEVEPGGLSRSRTSCPPRHLSIHGHRLLGLVLNEWGGARLWGRIERRAQDERAWVNRSRRDRFSHSMRPQSRRGGDVSRSPTARPLRERTPSGGSHPPLSGAGFVVLIVLWQPLLVFRELGGVSDLWGVSKGEARTAERPEVEPGKARLPGSMDPINRRGGDSNPRWVAPHLLSKQAP